MRVLVIYPGYLDWPMGGIHWDLDPALFPNPIEYEVKWGEPWGPWHRLSTFRGLGPGSVRAQETKREVCPHCSMALPVTGICDCHA